MGSIQRIVTATI